MNYITIAIFSFLMGCIASAISYRIFLKDRLAEEYQRGYKKAQKDMKEIEEYIKKNGMPGMVRVSLGAYNSEKEVNIFLETIEYICKKCL